MQKTSLTTTAAETEEAKNKENFEIAIHINKIGNTLCSLKRFNNFSKAKIVIIADVTDLGYKLESNSVE
jgi:hypothetical protein